MHCACRCSIPYLEQLSFCTRVCTMTEPSGNKGKEKAEQQERAILAISAEITPSGWGSLTPIMLLSLEAGLRNLTYVPMSCSSCPLYQSVTVK